MDKNRKSIQDNRGVTLLEVLIAVAIFSVAALILMQGFVTSGRINKKSNLYLEASSTAQNVMEELKSKSFEEAALAFNYPLDATYANGGYSRFSFLEQEAKDGLINTQDGITIRERIYDSKGNFVNVKTSENGGTEGDPLSASILSEDGGKTYTLNPRKKGTYASRYYFEMLNVTNKYETFDIQVTYDGSKYADYKKESTLEEDEKNDYESPNIAKLDNKENGFLIMNKVWDSTALTNMITKQKEAADAQWTVDKENWEKTDGTIYPVPQPTALDEEDVYNHMKRTLIVDLYENNGIVTAKASYKLSAYAYDKTSEASPYAAFGLCPCGGTGENSDTAQKDCFCTYRSVETAFYASDANVELKNLYLFYYPNYASTDRLNPLDNIEFRNHANYPVNLYVVKEKGEELTDVSQLSRNESSYKMKLTVTENPAENGNANWFTNLNLFRAQTKLRTNLDSDISEEKVSERRTVKQMTLYYTSSSGKKISDKAAQSVLSFNGLDDRQQKDRIYKVTVNVYKKGAAWKGFPKEDWITSLEGSRED